MRWRKLGLVYAPQGDKTWARSHAMLPTCLPLGPDRLRIYYAATDEKTVGRIGYVEVDPKRPTKILFNTPEPIFDIGEPGCFDDNGVCPSCLIEQAGVLRFFYVGFQLQTKIPYTMFTGLANGEAGGVTFHRASKVPILDRRKNEPFFRTAAHIVRDGHGWRSWYIGGGGWVEFKGVKKPSYELRHARSMDGVCWTADGDLCLTPNIAAGEIGFGRPFVLYEDGIWKMIYSIRTETGYKLGYAISNDGIQWERRDDEVGIGVSETGWDSQMVCYGAVQDTAYGRLLFYNGNQYGKSGFGVAIAE